LTEYHVNFWGLGENFTFKFAPDKKAIDQKGEWLDLYEPILQGKQRQLDLLDIGAGAGAFCGAVSEFGISAYGLEPNKFSFAEAQSSFPECRFLHGSADDLLRGKFNADDIPESFDIITMHDVLEHVADPAGLLAALQNILSPGGKLYIRVPSGDHLQFDFLQQYSWTMMAPFHRTLFSRKGFQDMLNEAGFKITKSFPTGHVYGWTRGLSWKLGLEKEYREMRKNKNFVALDYAIDTLLEGIASDSGRESSIFCEIESFKNVLAS
jgi:SAM-dependent methyltransferase